MFQNHVGNVSGERFMKKSLWAGRRETVNVSGSEGYV